MSGRLCPRVGAAQAVRRIGRRRRRRSSGMVLRDRQARFQFTLTGTGISPASSATRSCSISLRRPRSCGVMPEVSMGSPMCTFTIAGPQQQGMHRQHVSHVHQPHRHDRDARFDRDVGGAFFERANPRFRAAAFGEQQHGNVSLANQLCAFRHGLQRCARVAPHHRQMPGARPDASRARESKTGPSWRRSEAAAGARCREPGYPCSWHDSPPRRSWLSGSSFSAPSTSQRTKQTASSMRDHCCASRCWVRPARSHSEQIREMMPIPAVRRMTAGAEKKTARSFHTLIDNEALNAEPLLSPLGVL